jgi:hypothetical protein
VDQHTPIPRRPRKRNRGISYNDNLTVLLFLCGEKMRLESVRLQ